MQKAALEFHVNSFAPLHNAIRCDYFRRPVDVPLSDYLSIRVEGTAQTLMALSPMCYSGSFFIGFPFAFFSSLFKLDFALDSLRSTNGACMNE